MPPFMEFFTDFFQCIPIFEKQVPAADNRVTAIVPAYDRAVAEVLKDIVAWTTEQAKPG